MASIGFNQLSQPATNPPPASAARGSANPACDFYLNGVSGSVRTYKRTGLTWAWLATTSLTFPAANGLRISPDGNYVACGSNATTPGHGIYKIDTTTGAVTACTLTGTAVGSVSYGVAWHPSSNYVAIAIGAGGTPSAVIAIFKKVDATTWNLLTTISKGGAGTGVSWSTDGTRLVCHGNNTPWLEVYNFNSATDTFTAVSGTPVDTQPGSNVMRGFRHNPIDDTLVCLRSSAPCIDYYAWEPTANSGNGQYQKKAAISGTSGVQANYGSFPAWTPDGKHLIVPLSASPWTQTFDYDLATKTLTVASIQNSDFSAATYDVAIGDDGINAVIVGAGAKFYNLRNTAAYDATGFLMTSATTIDINETVTVAYDAAGFLMTSATNLHAAMEVTYAASGFLMTSDTTLGYHDKLTYNATGFLMTSDTSLGYKDFLTYDATGFLMTSDTVLEPARLVTYDAAGFLMTGEATAQVNEWLAYDAVGYLMTSDTSIEDERFVTYDAAGYLMTGATDLEAGEALTYDAVGFLMTGDISIEDGRFVTYDASGFLMTGAIDIELPSHVTYDASGFLMTAAIVGSQDVEAIVDSAGFLMTAAISVTVDTPVPTGEAKTDYIMLQANTWTQIGEGSTAIKIAILGGYARLRVRLDTAEPADGAPGILLCRLGNLPTSFEIQSMPSGVGLWALASKDTGEAELVVNSH